MKQQKKIFIQGWTMLSCSSTAIQLPPQLPFRTQFRSLQSWQKQDEKNEKKWFQTTKFQQRLYSLSGMVLGVTLPACMVVSRIFPKQRQSRTLSLSAKSLETVAGACICAHQYMGMQRVLEEYSFGKVRKFLMGVNLFGSLAIAVVFYLFYLLLF